MGLKKIVIELSTSDDDVKGSGRWKDGKTNLILTPKDPPTLGTWNSNRESDIDSGGGSDHATYELKTAQKTLYVQIGGYSGDTSTQTPVTLSGIDEFKVGAAGSGNFVFRKLARTISWKILKPE